ncbi:glycosyltransferase family 2 protein [Marinobacter nauticus]|uniref:Glycosyl transferase family 2 n=1 Tax=Marinobacter nauticus TaxID=2743 RepID=A0A368UXR6_MARNT|nr:glycosyltransferase family A protein [Marinobacter nauticus]RBP72689.1 glycosyl transferase family 2 [Marinobacter nauticus]RCW33616.1 glycosyl transferase family 2 [Marinobacter nauticus]
MKSYNRHLRPTVTVICHSYNHAPYIRQTLESILMQETDFPIEVIVHDDASTDGTAEIIREIVAKEPGRIFPIFQEDNQFSQGNRPSQFTIPKAKGEYIALCEGDDYWIGCQKLQKQVDALRRHPELALCVHPAMRFSMRTGRQKRGFYYGSNERIMPPQTVVARHNQFAPTASILMRAEQARKLPSWFFVERGLPVGDFFIEAILGRKGVLYIPDIMSVYRRNVPESYTNRFRRSAGPSLEDSMFRMLYFTEKLRGIDGIPENALNQRLCYIRLNYALQFLAMGDKERFDKVTHPIRLKGHRFLLIALAVIRNNELMFNIARKVFVYFRRLRD